MTDTAVPHREQGWNLLLPSVWTDPADTERTSPGRARARPRSPSTSPTSRWLNYLGDDQGEDAVRNAYGPNYARLVEVKRRYDPGNVFRQNHNIAP